ncbi:conserved hypothetical protein, partial [Trichinella spiralis]|uniref:hypothetical protein n=1 Tax=Trichinella spiralis TaxID=6334 RepID=UPI0001EFE818
GEDEPWEKCPSDPADGLECSILDPGAHHVTAPTSSHTTGDHPGRLIFSKGAETNSGFDIRCSSRRAGENQRVVRPTLAPQTGATVWRKLRKSRALAALTKGMEE